MPDEEANTKLDRNYLGLSSARKFNLNNNMSATDYYATATTSLSVYTTSDDDSSTILPENFTFHMRLIVSCVLLVTSTIGICGNSLVILSVLLSRKLRSATYEFVFNLSCADLLTSLMIPINVVALTSTADHGWPFADWICTAAGGVLFLCTGCSLFTLASISVERLLVCTRQVIYYRKFCSGAFSVWIIATWLVPFVILILPTFFGIGEFGYDDMYHSCAAKSNLTNTQAYNLIMAATGSILLTVMILAYTLILVYVIRRGKKTVKMFTTSQENLMVIQETQFHTEVREIDVMSATNAGRDLSARLRRRQFLLAKHMFYVVCAFLLCVIPYGVCVAVPGTEAYLPYAATLLLFNGAINPVIYTRHRDFRQIFLLILRRRWGDIPKPSRLLNFLLGQ